MLTHSLTTGSLVMLNIRIAGTALLLMATTSCDTTVTNPGPVQDEFLADRTAATALVNGAGRALSAGINWISYTGAAVAREIHPAGSTGSFGISARWQNGELNADDADLNTHWELAQRARWLAEETIRRLEAAGPPPAGSGQTPAQYATALQQAYVYAGYANRVLGDNMCEAVIDGSAALPVATFFTRAESLFTKALAVTGAPTATAAKLMSAAYAGRAQSPSPSSTTCRTSTSATTTSETGSRGRSGTRRTGLTRSGAPGTTTIVRRRTTLGFR